MIRIKICGITNLSDAMVAIAAGADALGFVFHQPSPRNLFTEQATAIIRQLPPFIQTVGLFVNQQAELVNETAKQCKLDLVQLHGEETPEYCNAIKPRIIKAFRVKDSYILNDIKKYDVAGYLLDAWSPVAHGGTGETFNWDIATNATSHNNRIILAGGLTPENIAAAIKCVKPYAVDVSSGVESAPGIKNAQKIQTFIQNAIGAI